MRRNDIDNMLDAMAKEAAEKGDDNLLPGAICFNSSTWVRLSGAEFPTTCVSVKVGIRYRGVSVLVSSMREDAVLNRTEDGGRGKDYMDLEPRA